MDGLLNKDRDFWTKINEFDVIGMVETWVEEKNQQKLSKMLPKEYRWRISPALKEKRKGRARKGMVVGVRKDIEEEKEEDSQLTEDINMRQIRLVSNEIWKIFTVYCPQGEEKKIWKTITENVNEPEVENMLIMGDMNARIGEKGSLILWEEELEVSRNSMDKTLNNAGKVMLEVLEQRNWSVLNGNVAGDLEGNFTFYGAGQSVIDYMVVNPEALGRVKTMEVINRVESSHMPLKLEILEEIDVQSKQKVRKVFQVWNEESIGEFKKKTDQMKFNSSNARETMSEFVDKINEATLYKTIFLEGIGYSKQDSWWDRECKEEKTKLNQLLRSKKKGKTNFDKVKEARQIYKELCRRKKREKQSRVHEEIRSIKNNQDRWKYLNKYRRKTKNETTSITSDQWRNYYMELLEGGELTESGDEEINRDKNEEALIDEEINNEEITAQIKRLKKKKSSRRR